MERGFTGTTIKDTWTKSRGRVVAGEGGGFSSPPWHAGSIKVSFSVSTYNRNEVVPTYVPQKESLLSCIKIIMTAELEKQKQKQKY